MGKLFSDPIICCPVHVSSTCAREKGFYIRPVNIQTLPRVIICAVTQETDWRKIKKVLDHSQYDRCVFRCNNDVVDHQVCIFQFENGITATHTMDAFSREIYRDIKIHGTKAELVGVMEKNFLELRTFGGKAERVAIPTGAVCGGHGGGDNGIMRGVYDDYNGKLNVNITYLKDSYESHKMAFAAEQARVTGKTVNLV